MRKFFEYLGEDAMEIINFKKKKWIFLKQQKSKQDTKICYICQEKIEYKHAKDENFCKVTDHC